MPVRGWELPAGAMHSPTSLFPGCPWTACAILPSPPHLDDGIAPVHERELLAIVQLLGIVLVQPDLGAAQ
eukprot:1137380-Pelagomonas_calceolata.AAC.10